MKTEALVVEFEDALKQTADIFDESFWPLDPLGGALEELLLALADEAAADGKSTRGLAQICSRFGLVLHK